MIVGSAGTTHAQGRKHRQQGQRRSGANESRQAPLNGWRLMPQARAARAAPRRPRKRTRKGSLALGPPLPRATIRVSKSLRGSVEGAHVKEVGPGQAVPRPSVSEAAPQPYINSKPRHTHRTSRGGTGHPWCHRTLGKKQTKRLWWYRTHTHHKRHINGPAVLAPTHAQMHSSHPSVATKQKAPTTACQGAKARHAERIAPAPPSGVLPLFVASTRDSSGHAPLSKHAPPQPLQPGHHLARRLCPSTSTLSSFHPAASRLRRNGLVSRSDVCSVSCRAEPTTTPTARQASAQQRA